MYDVAIVGLGPAGSTLARSLDSGLRVLAVDRGDFAATGAEGAPLPAKGKCCGGLLAHDAQKSLAKFGLTLPRDILVDPQIFAVRTIDLHSPGERYYQRFYLNMDRHRFDNWLRSLIPPQVDVVERARCADFQWQGDHYTFTVTRGQDTSRHRARVIVGADGGGSRVRRECYPDSRIRRYLAVQEWFAQDDAAPYYASVFDLDITDCYGWSIHKDGILVVGAALPQEDAGRRFALLKERLAARGYHFGERLRREGCFVYRPTGFSSFVTGRNSTYLAGEAAGFISPSSLEGISYAMDSGYLLALALNGRNTPSRTATHYARSTLPMRCRLVGKCLKNPFMYHPFLRRAVMSSGLFSIDLA